MILNPVDFKNYLYCPRQIYYKYIQKFETEPTVKMISGQNMHLLFSRMEKRRSLKKYGIEDFKRNFNIKIYSKDDMLSGEIDMVLSNETEMIAVDFKMTETMFLDGYILQLYAYSKLIRSQYGKKSDYGFLVFINTEKIKKIIFSKEIEEEYINIRNNIINMIDSERFPEIVYEGRCFECEYVNFCRDTE